MATPTAPVSATVTPTPQATSEAPKTAVAAPKAPETTAQAQARMMKLKIDGQEMELPEGEVIKLAQQCKAADKRFQEAAVTRKQAEDIIAYAKSNPAEFFAKTGMNARQWAEEFLLGEIQREQMSPEQSKAAENERLLKEYQSKEKAAADKARADQMQALEQQHMQSYDQIFTKALGESGLPKTAYTVKRMAELTLINVKKGLDLEPMQLAKIVREDYQNEMKALYGQADGDSLLELLGKDAVKKLSKAQLSKYKATKVNNGAAQPKVPATKPANPVDAWRQMKKKTRSLM